MKTENKPVRKYSVFQRVTQYTRYLLHRGVVDTLTLSAILVWMAAMLLCITGGLAVVVILMMAIDKPHARIFAVIVIACYAILLGGGYGSTRLMDCMLKVDGKGKFFHPVPPERNEVLPDADVLVRASMPNNAETLLRAAASTPDAAPEILLRAAATTDSNALSQTTDAKSKNLIVHE